MTVISKRFRQFRKHLGYTQTSYGKLFNLSQDAISAIETGKNKPTIEVLTILHDTFNLNVEWMLLGKGEMFNPDPIPVEMDLAYTILNEVPKEISEDEIPVYVPVVYSASPEKKLQSISVSQGLVASFDKENVKAIYIEGDAMSPSLSSGDIAVFVNGFLPNTDGLYVMEAQGGMMVKRVYYKNNGSVVIYSDNERYPKEEVDAGEKDNLPIAGKVILVIQKF